MSAQTRDRSAPDLLNSGSDFANSSCREPANRSQGASVFEWKTRARLFGIPLICIACGRDQRGRPRVAKGFVAIGQFAVGGLAIGQFGVGLISVGQFAMGVVAVGQLAVSPLVGFGQVALGIFAIGQFVIGKFARGQFGWAEHLWSPDRTDMEAVAMFGTIEWLVQQDLVTIWETIKDAIELGL